MNDIKRQIWSDGSIVYQEKQTRCCSNTVKVLDKDLIIHQLYEIILEQQKQIKNLGELFNNLKTMFRVANEINKDDTIKTNNNTTNSQVIKNNIRYEKANYISDEGPNFFI